MFITRGRSLVTSELTVDEDLDFLTSWQVKNLASPASGEALRKGSKDITNAELGWTVDKLLKGAGTGSDPTEIDVPSGTLELFVPCSAGTGIITMGIYGAYAGIGCDNTKFAACSFKVPHDFTTLVAVELIIIPQVTKGDGNLDIYSNYAANGEAYTTHSESDEATTYDVTADTLYALDLSDILTGLAADDYVGVRILNSDASLGIVLVLGLRFRYS